jgi:hypothetical protein
MTYDDIIIEAVPMVIGGVIGVVSTLLVTHYNIKAKRSESELNYKRKWEERYILNAQKHSEVYESLYNALTLFQDDWIEPKKTINLEDLKSAIDKLKSLKKSLGKKGLTAFLTQDIESCFDHLLNFLSKSQGASQVRYGLIQKYKMLGEEKSSYNVLPEVFGKMWAVLGFRVGFHLGNGFNLIIGLIDDYEFEIILDSAPLDSVNKQLSDSLVEIKNKIKGITLGPGANIV